MGRRKEDALSVERVREVLNYDQDTGLFTRRITLGARAMAGAIAGSVYPDGRRRVQIDCVTVFASRLAWLYVYGRWPDAEVDHVNMVRCDDRISNLRLATHQQNNANRRALSNNTTGRKGVSLLPQQIKRRYRARIVVADRAIHLGYFATADEAGEAYYSAAKKYFGEFARSV